MILLSLTRLKMVLLLIGIKCKELADFLINFVIFIFIFIIQFIFIFISFQVIVVSAACRSIEVGNSFAANVHCSYFQYISTLDSVLDWCSDFGGGRALRMGIVEAEG